MLPCMSTHLILLCLAGFSSADLWTQNTALRKQLLKNYDRMTMPTTGHDENGTITVSIGLNLRGVWIEDHSQRLIVNGWLVLYWVDERLKWDYKDYGNLHMAHFAPSELWVPDITVYNNAEITNVNHYGHTHMLVYSDGSVLWVPPSRTATECHLDYKLLPFDTHTCKMKWGSWTAHGYQINLEPYNNETELHTEEMIKTSHMWKLLSATQRRNVVKYECCEEPYIDIDMTFKLQRDAPTFTAIFIVPAIVLPLLLLLQYILPVDNPKRMSLGFFVLFMVVLEQLYLKAALPGLSTSVPLIVSYYSLLFVIVVVTIAFSTVLSRISHPQHPLLAFAPPAALKTVLTGPVATVLFLKDHAGKVGLSGKENPEDGEVLADVSQTNYSHEWLFIAKVIDRIVFVVILLIYVLSMISYLAPIS